MSDEMTIHPVEAMVDGQINTGNGKLILTLQLASGTQLSLEFTPPLLTEIIAMATQMVSGSAPGTSQDGVMAIPTTATAALPVQDADTVVVQMQDRMGLVHQFELPTDLCNKLRVQIRKAEEFQNALRNQKRQ
ncbi:hypothetical protein [Ancylobacter oerskovii]|uniref:Uncharacterized protein n=1 Tax=Ancylobacter oerskovii TaxID=459519 RepID=A0ABW4Z4Y8_9HYPH|nr:hypothetical protein [Ancylobacter oerskovii]MBS7543047.1 hypothetical protein [Ancylobacter oerskovii]